MKKYWVIMCGEFQGCRIFQSEDEAQEAATRMTAISGKEWKVREIYG